MQLIFFIVMLIWSMTNVVFCYGYFCKQSGKLQILSGFGMMINIMVCPVYIFAIYLEIFG